MQWLYDLLASMSIVSNSGASNGSYRNGVAPDARSSCAELCRPPTQIQLALRTKPAPKHTWGSFPLRSRIHNGSRHPGMPVWPYSEPRSEASEPYSRPHRPWPLGSQDPCHCGALQSGYATHESGPLPGPTPAPQGAPARGPEKKPIFFEPGDPVVRRPTSIFPATGITAILS